MLSIVIIAEPLGEASNRGARSHNAFVCMHYLYPSQSISDTLINRTIGMMVQQISQRFLGSENRC